MCGEMPGLNPRRPGNREEPAACGRFFCGLKCCYVNRRALIGGRSMYRYYDTNHIVPMGRTLILCKPTDEKGGGTGTNGEIGWGAWMTETAFNSKIRTSCGI